VLAPPRAARSQRALSHLAFLLRALIGVWLYTFSLGCASPPDPAAFATATRSLETSVRAVGASTREQLTKNEATQHIAIDFERHWSARNHAMRAAADYSQSLVKTFAEANATQPASLSKSLQTLAHSLGVGGTIDPATNGIGVWVGVLATTADTIAFVHAQIALVQASRSLDEAIARAQPVIERIAQLIVADTADLEKFVHASAALQRLDLAAEFNEPLAFAESVDRRRSEIRRVSYGNLSPADLEELTRIEGLKASIASDLAPYFSGLASIAERESDAITAIRSTRSAIESWAAVHQSLAQSTRDHQPLDIDRLTESIAKLQSLLARTGDR